MVQTALDEGITHFDTAEMYGGGKSEEFLGRALGSRRGEVIIATKFVPRPKEEPYEPGALARRAREGCELSLRRLGSDYIDLYYQHYPDPDAPIDEALEVLDGLVTEGKVRHIACSNYSAQQLEPAAELSEDRHWARFVANQIEWSLINRTAEASTVPTADRLGIGVVPYFPLASGMLTGKYHKGEPFPEGTRFAAASYFSKIATDENFDYVDSLTAFAEERGHSVLELAIAWLAAQAGVPSVIAGATSPEQVKANAAAAAWTLSDADLAAVPRPG